MAFVVNLADLTRILSDIQIAEAHASGLPGTALTDQINSPLLPFGLRTVDGSYNNLLPGQENWGAADQTMPRLLDPDYRDDQDGDTMPLGPGMTVTNTDYGAAGNVADADPRIISNLIVDQSINNPAAVISALSALGSADPYGDAQIFLDAQAAFQAAQDALPAAVAANAAAQGALTTAQDNASAANSQAASDAAAAAGAQADADIEAGQAADTAQDLFEAQAALLTAQTNATTAAAAEAAAQSAFDAAEAAANTAAGEAAVALAARDAALLDFLAAGTAQGNAQATLSTEQAELDALINGNAPQTEIDAQILVRDAAQGAYAAAVVVFNTELGEFTASLNTLAVANAASSAANAAQAAAQTTLNTAIANSGVADAAVATAQDNVDTATAANNQAQQEAIDAQDAANAAAATAASSAEAADAAAVLLDAAEADAATAASALTAAQALITSTQATLDGVPAAIGLEFDINDLSVMIPNVAPDEGLSAPVNGWMSLFGQFFDHGLDLIPKANNGTVFIPLQEDDPLYVSGGHTNFMVVTRADVDANGDVINLTTPFVDQNQTYTSHPSHQVFLREYVMIGGEPMNTGRLLEGSAGGPATWADVKAQARDLLGIDLTDIDILNVPLLATDPYGNFIRGANGLPQVVMDNGAGGTVLVEGVVGAAIDLTNAVRTGHAFLDDIAHNAAPGAGEVADADSDISTAGQQQPAGTYDNELLDRHFITGDGRGNENIGLTTVHHVFHSEHNRLVEEYKHTILDSGDLAFINEWLLEPVLTLPSDVNSVVWNGERLFQAGRWVTEMQYQHLVFEEFGRTIQPNIDAFVFSNTADINPAIFAEFAHVVYRFGHSMLTEEVHRLDGAMVDNDIGLIEAFLNPVAFTELNGGTVSAEEGAGAVVRAMTRVAANELDEFTTEALRNNLVGLPLDLAAINIARARETGVPSLNEARRQFHEMTGGDALLRPYTSWSDFAQNIKNPASIVNFIAAYGTHSTITSAVTAADKRAAAMDLVFGTGGVDPEDRLDFLNAEGAYAGGSLGGLNEVDFWIGGLAEEIMPFGGMLGSTFNFVFEAQMQNLQDGDRFYYLSRTQGMNILNQLEANSFAALIMRNTDLGDGTSSHLPGHVFATPAYTFEIDQSLEAAGQVDPVLEDPYLGALTELVVRDVNFLQYTGGDHVVLGGTNDANTLIGGDGDDTLWGDGGNDRLEGGFGVDMVMGGDGDDIITDAGDIDMLKGGAGNDVIHAGNGLGDLVFGESGSDFLIGGVDSKEIFAGEGNDFVLGSEGASLNLGNEGDDWLEGGMGFDTLAGENSELFFNSPIIGHDVLDGKGNDTDYDGESGDDIMFQNAGIQRNNGMAGFDWTIHKGDINGADSDLGIPIFVNQQAVILRDRFDLVEGLSGWKHDDSLFGREIVTGANGAAGAAAEFDANDKLESFSNALLQSSVDRIDGFDQLVAHLGRVDWTWAGETHTVVVMDEAAVQRDGNDVVTFVDDTSADILLGGGGSDTMMGKDGNDIIDGDRWLNVRIAVSDVVVEGVPYPDATADGLTSAVYTDATMSTALFDGRPLHSLMLDRTLTTSQLSIVREILDGGQELDIDTALFRDARANYDVTRNGDGSLTVAHNGTTVFVADRETGVVIERSGSDGTDRLFGVEVLRFESVNANGDAVVQEIRFDGPNTLPNAADPGFPMLAITDEEFSPLAGAPVEDQVLQPAMNFEDADGIVFESLNFTWEAETAPGVWTVVATTEAFAPGDAEVGLPLRVVAHYVDGLGVFETVTSTVTLAVENINDGPGGGVTIDDLTPVAGEVLTAVNAITDADGLTGATYSYQWESSPSGADGTWVLIGGATGESYTTTQSDIGRHFRVLVSYEDDGSTTETVTSAAVGAVAAFNTINGNGLLTGTPFADQINGGAGDDTLIGLASNDVLDGGTGVDAASYAEKTAGISVTLNGASFVDVSVGGVVEDSIRNIENVIGGSGADWVIGDTSNNRLEGGEGDDVLAGRGGMDFIDGGAGVDRVGYSELGVALSVALNGSSEVQVFVGGVAEDTIVNIENVTGGSGDDVFTGDSLANRLEGAGGHDTLDGAGGNDVLVGGLGNDFLLGGGGVDTIDGGAGTDTASYDGYADVVSVSLNRHIYVNVSIGGVIADSIRNVENVIGGSANDALIGDLLGNQLFGGEGDDVLAGRGGNDVIDGGAGIDRAGYAEKTQGIEVTLDGSTAVQVSVGGVIEDSLVNVENVSGGSGNDSITGDSLANRLEGGAGSDTLNGGQGDDVLIGGSGNDVFVFGLNAGNDRIGGFVDGEDLLDLVALGITDFANEVSITASGSSTVVGFDGGSVTLVGVTGSITEADFILA